MALLLQDHYLFFFDHPWGVLPWKQTSAATGPTSELVLRWPLCQTQCVLYRLALKFCMSLVHSDSASSSRSSGLCRCLLWDNACGNPYLGLLISVAADPYRFDLRKLIKGPAPSACSVQPSPSSEGSPFPWVHHSQGMVDAFFSAFWYQGGASLPGHLKTPGLGAPSWGWHISWELWPEDKASVWAGISLKLGSSWIVALSALDVDSNRDFPGNLFL